MKSMILLTLLVVAFVAVTSAQPRPSCPQAARPPNCTGGRNVGTRCPATPPRRMWYYNQATRTCLELPYLGCGGNANRFCSLAYCQRRCVRTTG